MSVCRLGRLQESLLGAERLRAGHDAVELLDPGGELLSVAEFLGDVLRQRLLDLLSADAVGVDRVGDVAHHRLDLHPVGLLEHRDELLAVLAVLLGEDVLRTPCLTLFVAPFRRRCARVAIGGGS